MIYAGDMHGGNGSAADDFGGRNGPNAQWLHGGDGRRNDEGRDCRDCPLCAVAD